MDSKHTPLSFGESESGTAESDSEMNLLTLSSLYESPALWISGATGATERDFDLKYELLETIGRGQTSEVKVVRNRATGELFACKLMDKRNISAPRLRQEVRVLLAVRHPNIVSLHEVFETDSDLRLVVELVEGGELFQRILQKKVYSEREACEVVASLLGAVSFLHDRNIIHRDIKPENILLASHDSDVEIKLSDFGYAKMFEELDEDEVLSYATVSSPKQPRSRQQRAFTTVGTDFYIAPEILRGEGYGKAVDMWSVGVVAYILLCGFPPFPDVSKIREGEFAFPSPFWDGVSFLAQDFVKRLLTVDPDQRMSAKSAMQHPWITARHARNAAQAEESALSPHHSHMFRKFNKKRRGFTPPSPNSL